MKLSPTGMPTGIASPSQPLLVVLVAALAILLAPFSTAVPPPAQLLALEALFNSTNGPDWDDFDSWMTGDPCSTDSGWFGIDCDSSGDNIVYVSR